jgi:hypothetical protein
VTRYAYPLPARDEAQLHSEIAALGLGGFQGVCGSGPGAEVLFAADLAAADLARLDAAVAAHAPSAAWAAAQLRGAAKALAADPQPPGKLTRSVLLTLLGEVNALRSWLAQFQAATAASASLADLKARVAALPAVPPRTAAQAKAAVLAELDSGESD